jgi:hypothetical protein
VAQSLRRQRVQLVQPIIPREEVLDGHAEFHLAGAVQKFEDQIVALKLKTAPNFPHAALGQCQRGLFLTLFVNLQTSASDHCDLLLPTPKKRIFPDFSYYSGLFGHSFTDCGLDAGRLYRFPAHDLQLLC